LPDLDGLEPDLGEDEDIEEIIENIDRFGNRSATFDSFTTVNF
jgi:hypothetical protein